MKPCAKPDGCSQCGRHTYRLPASLLVSISTMRHQGNAWEILLWPAIAFGY